MNAELAAAIDGLYRAFEGYPRPQWFEGCACCWAGEPLPGGNVRVSAPGGSRPLRTLARVDLDKVAFEAPITGGTREVHKHYLPRILEMAITGGFEFPDLSTVFGRLNEPTYLGGGALDGVADRGAGGRPFVLPRLLGGPVGDGGRRLLLLVRQRR